MRSFIGKSSNMHVETAIAEATRGMTEPDFIIFMTPYEELEKTAELLHKKYEGIPSIGTLGITMANGNVSSDSTVVIGFFDVTVSADIIEEISKCPVSHIGKLERNVQAVHPGRENTVCIEFCTGEEERLVTTLNAGLERYQIGLVGGTVFGQPKHVAGVVAYNGKIYKDACTYAIIKNRKGKVKIYKENIYEKKSDITHQATKVDLKNKGLIELDYKPAYEVYSKELGVPQYKIIDNVLANPMGRAVGREVFISSMRKLTSDGTIINFKRINENDTICFLSLMDYELVGESTRNKIKSDIRHASLVFTIDCIYRYILFESQGYIKNHARNMALLGPHVGVVGGGEQYNNQHVNQTMVCAVFE